MANIRYFAENRFFMYTIRVKFSRRYAFLCVLTSTLIVASCGSEPDSPSFTTVGPLTGVQASVRLLTMNRVLPSALLGPYVSAYLSSPKNFVYRSALEGIGAQVRLRRTPDELQSETFALLQEFGAVLQVDIMDLLNRSENRSQTLDDYMATLRDLTIESRNKVTQLDEQRDTLRDDLREHRSTLSEIRGNLNRVLRDQDYAAAGIHQQELVREQAEVSRLSVEEDELRSNIRVFEQLLDVSEERWGAIVTNREAILAGIHVIEVPGIEDIGVFREETREEERDRESDAEEIFGE